MALEPLAGYPPLPLRARVSVSCTDPGPWPAARPVPIGGGLPLQEVADGMKVMYERVAGIDVHKDMIKVAIRSPGDKPWTRKTEILEYRTFYGVLQEMARELRRRGVTHVVMEASGVYTEPVYYALAEQDFTEVAVINPAHAKALKGHKTDAKDCARLAELFECGLLRGSYIPSAEQKEVRDLTRYRTRRSRPAPRRSSGWARRWNQPASSSARWPARLPARRHRDDRGADRRGTPRRACWRTWPSAGCGPPGSWPTCRWR